MDDKGLRRSHSNLHQLPDDRRWTTHSLRLSTLVDLGDVGRTAEHPDHRKHDNRWRLRTLGSPVCRRCGDAVGVAEHHVPIRNEDFWPGPNKFL